MEKPAFTYSKPCFFIHINRFVCGKDPRIQDRKQSRMLIRVFYFLADFLNEFLKAFFPCFGSFGKAGVNAIITVSGEKEGECFLRKNYTPEIVG